MNAVNPIQSPTSPAAGGAEPSMEEILASIRKIIADDSATPRLDGPRDRDADETVADAAEPGRIAGQHPPHVPPEVEQALEPLLHEPLLHEPHLHEPHLHEPHLHEPAFHEARTPVHEPAAARSPADEPAFHEPEEKLLEDERGPAAPHASSEETMAESIADLPKHPLAPPAEAMGLGPVVHDEPVPGGSAPHRAAGEAPPAPERLFASAVGSSVSAAFNTLAASRFVDNSEQLTGLVSEMIRPLVKAWVDEHLPGMVERLVVAEIERMARGGR